MSAKSGRRKRLLWVDDDASFIDSQIAEVRREYDVDVARGPDEFWEKIKPGYYGGIIMDILLPYGKTMTAEQANGGLKTGLALIEALKETPTFKDIPLVVFTIRMSADVDDLAEKYGIPVVRKQDSLDELLDAIRKAFG